MLPTLARFTGKTLKTFAPLKRKVFLEDLPFPGMEKAATGKYFAEIIFGLLFS